MLRHSLRSIESRDVRTIRGVCAHRVQPCHCEYRFLLPICRLFAASVQACLKDWAVALIGYRQGSTMVSSSKTTTLSPRSLSAKDVRHLGTWELTDAAWQKTSSCRDRAIIECVVHHRQLPRYLHGDDPV